MWMAGHSLIKDAMQRFGSLMAGEMSGHMFFRHRWYGFDCAVYAGDDIALFVHGSNSIGVAIERETQIGLLTLHGGDELL